MQNIKFPVVLLNVCFMVLLLAACSGDKVIPQGKRISVLEQSSSVKPDFADGASRINVPATVDNSEWAQKGNNAQHVSGNYRVSNQFKKLWKADFGKGASKREFLISAPIADNAVVYTLDANGLVRAFRLTDGEVLWATDLEPDNKHEDATAMKGVGLAKNGGVIYAVSGYGSVFALNAKSGAIIWQKDLQMPLRIAPTYSAGKIFIQSTDNKIFALDAGHGEILWDYDIAMEETTRVGGAAPAYSADFDVVIAGFSNGEIQALNASLGTALWSDMLISNRQAYSSTYLHAIKADPIVDKNVVYALGSSEMLVSLDLRSGERVWERNIGGEQTPLLVGNVLYIVSDQNELIALEKTSGKVLWATTVNLTKKDADVRVFSPMMINSDLLLTFSDGRVFVFDAKTGKQKNSMDLDEKLNGAPIAVNGYLIFTTANAKLIVFK